MLIPEARKAVISYVLERRCIKIIEEIRHEIGIAMGRMYGI